MRHIHQNFFLTQNFELKNACRSINNENVEEKNSDLKRASKTTDRHPSTIFFQKTQNFVFF